MIEQLQKLDLFSSLSSDELQDIAYITTIEKFKKDNIVFYEGDTPNYFYLLIDGFAKVYKVDPKGTEIVLHNFVGTTLIAEMASIEGFNFPATCICMEDSTFALIKKVEFLKLDLTSPIQIKSNSVDVVIMFHTLHHILQGYKERLQDIYRMLKNGGIFALKDHNVQTRSDCENVNFEHFVYSIGEGAATINDLDTYKNIEPILCFSANDVSLYLKSLGFKELSLTTFQNPTKTYNAVFQKT